jgi:hypothetical protein
MRYLILLAILLTGCSSNKLGRDYKVGDCFMDKEKSSCERWNHCARYTYKVLEIGKFSYRTFRINLKASYPTADTWDEKFVWEGLTDKVQCPRVLNAYDETLFE